MFLEMLSGFLKKITDDNKSSATNIKIVGKRLNLLYDICDIISRKTGEKSE